MANYNTGFVLIVVFLFIFKEFQIFCFSKFNM